MSVIGLIPLQDSPVPTVLLLTTTTRKPSRLTDYLRRQAGFVLCQLPLKRRSWHHTAQQILTNLLASATAALLWPIRADDGNEVVQAIDLQLFMIEVTHAAGKWLEAMQGTKPFETNAAGMLRCRPHYPLALARGHSVIA